MTEQSSKPIIFLVFANSSTDPLPKLEKEYHQLRSVVGLANQRGHCELVIEPYAKIDNILATFDDERYRNRIAVFHFAGHTDSYELLLQDANGQPAAADAGGLSGLPGPPAWPATGLSQRLLQPTTSAGSARRRRGRSHRNQPGDL